MNLIINGQPREMAGWTFTVGTLLETLELGQAPVLVDLNGEAVLSREFEGRAVCEGDVIEIIHMVAGG